MNIYDMMKNLKNIQQGFEEVKKDLRLRKDMIEMEGVEIIFNGMGEILDIEIKDESLKEDWSKLKPVLINAINRAESASRDIAKEEFNKKFGGLLGGLGFGI